MASFIPQTILKLFLAISLFRFSLAVRRLTVTELLQDQPDLLKYHDGPLLTGRITVNLIWYGNLKPSETAIISDFVNSLSSKPPPSQKSQPTVAQWWSTAQKYYHLDSKKHSLSLSLGKQILDEHYSLGKSLQIKQIIELASKGDQKDAINVVLTASDVVVEGFCMNQCGTHGHATGKKMFSKFAYIWVGNSQTQCPGQCAWPFYQPIYGPQSPPLIAPNNNVGLDGMVINLASLFAGTVTNPFGNGYFQGPAEAPLEASSACPGIYGKGAYPGYAGNLLVDSSTGASYNARGEHGRKYLLPALYDPATFSCETLTILPKLWTIEPNKPLGRGLSRILLETATTRNQKRHHWRPHWLALEYMVKDLVRTRLGDLPVDITTGASYNAHGVNDAESLYKNRVQLCF
ncbi:hypothetical protein V6N13_065562 [Hibiscus sabdariffa]|uniref:Uncharacterized protein n=1 Tax=Hibiscus sabdariffa TaxID=183260 RepID=A0ABR2QQV4_9ROSI